MINRNMHFVSARKHDATPPVMEVYLKILASLAPWRFLLWPAKSIGSLDC